MILTHPSFERMIDFDDEKIHVLIVENQNQLCSYIQELKDQVSGSDGNFSLFIKNDKVILSSTIKVVVDLFNLDINSKDILTSVSNLLIAKALSEDHYQDTNGVLAQLSRLLLDIISDTDVLIEPKEITIQDIVKIASVKLASSEDKLIFNICDYLDVYSRYSKIKIFIFVNIRDFLSDDEIIMLNQHILYNKLNVLFIESAVHKKHENESIILTLTV